MSKKQSTHDLPWADTVDQYDVSIIVPTYNRADYIEECLDSLLAQTLPAKEIIVIDDGSEDSTPEILHRYGERIRYVRKENGGKSSAVNLGLSLANGNLIWLFDDDDVSLPDAIATRIQILKNNPHAAFVYSSHYIGSNGKDGKIKKCNLYDPMLPEGSDFFYEVLKGCFFHLASTLVRIEAYQIIGKFDVNLIRSQDYDIQIRLAYQFTPAYAPNPCFIFRQHLGERGAKGHRTPGHARSKVFQNYDSHIGKKLRKNLPLGHYLVPKVETVVSIEHKRKALIARMVVMASKGCISEMFEDLQAALSTLESGARLNNNETSLIASAICTGYAYTASQADWPAFKRHITYIGNSSAGKQATHALAQGFFRLAKSYPGSLVDRTHKLIISIKIWMRLYA